MNETWLAHHGIKGQRWGIRRFQNEDGSLTAAGRRQAAKNYDYHESDEHKNSDSNTKRARTNIHTNYSRILGNKAANKIMYKHDKEGADYNKEFKKELTKQVVGGIALTAGAYLAGKAVGKAINAGKQKFAEKQYYAQMGSMAAQMAGEMEGLNTVKGGFSFSAGNKAAKVGKTWVDHLMNKGR